MEKLYLICVYVSFFPINISAEDDRAWNSMVVLEMLLLCE